MKYKSEITAWGKDSLFFLEDPETRVIILFNEDAPPGTGRIVCFPQEGRLYSGS